MLDNETMSMAEVLKAFAHPTRLLILRELMTAPKCVTDLEDFLPARQANISQHLAVLRYARLVDFAQDGALRCYYLARPQLVRDLVSIMGRNEPPVKRTAAEIRHEKEQLSKARKARTEKKGSRKRTHRPKVRAS